jgi:succinoglycan biosynthesis protein ExoA
MLEHRSATASYKPETRAGASTRQAGQAEHAPYISVVIPCFNEERFIGKVLQNLVSQYDSERLEIIVVDGMSTDETRSLVTEFIEERPELRVRLLDNPARNIPTALNLGVEQACGEVIVRMDAHSIPSANYVRRSVELLSDREVSVVGMPWRIEPGRNTLTARAIALAVSHPFGIGDAKYRQQHLASAQFVDTVPFGVFRKELWREAGGFNENLLSNEDYDFHYRVRQMGGRILLDASGHSTYFARGTVKELAAQYFRYGKWKAQMIKLHPASLRLRQTVAPLFVASLLLLSVLSLWWPVALWPLLAIIIAYALLASAFALQLSARGGDFKLAFVIPLAFFVIHTVWGSGFLLGLTHSPRK